MGHQFWVRDGTVSSPQAGEQKDSTAPSSVPTDDQKQHTAFLQHRANALSQYAISPDVQPSKISSQMVPGNPISHGRQLQGKEQMKHISSLNSQGHGIFSL